MGFMNKIAGYMKFGEDGADDEYYEEDDGYVEEREVKAEREEQPEETKVKTFQEKKAQPQPQKKRTIQMNDNNVCVFQPKAFDEAREIAETLLENKIVLMNFEGVDLSISQRVLDIVTGTCIAIGGNLQKISNYIFLATPASVDVSGNFQDTLGAFDAL